jgi:hypothetical protein
VPLSAVFQPPSSAAEAALLVSPQPPSPPDGSAFSFWQRTTVWPTAREVSVKKRCVDHKRRHTFTAVAALNSRIVSRLWALTRTMAGLITIAALHERQVLRLGTVSRHMTFLVAVAASHWTTVFFLRTVARKVAHYLSQWNAFTL